jgi:hypothetical protein
MWIRWIRIRIRIRIRNTEVKIGSVFYERCISNTYKFRGGEVILLHREETIKLDLNSDGFLAEKGKTRKQAEQL